MWWLCVWGGGADQATGLHRLELYTASLRVRSRKYAFLPGTLDLEKGAGPACADASAAQAEEVSAYLEQLNERAGALSIYVINLDGRVVATSNWRRPDSFMGGMQFRPYFRDALSRWHRAPVWHRHHARRAWLLPGICAARRQPHRGWRSPRSAWTSWSNRGPPLRPRSS